MNNSEATSIQQTTAEAETASIDFCGEIFPASAESPLLIGRGGDVVIDDNPYLHRHFLQLERQHGLWWLSNIGSQLSATVGDEHGAMQAWLAPGARLPLVFDRTVVRFTAGPTMYDFTVTVGTPPFTPVELVHQDDGNTTVGRITLTPDQHLLIVSLCEPSLRRAEHRSGAIPSSADAAARLGWTLTKFNRKLDNVCDKLTRNGIRGLHGGPERLATSRRGRLVEFALTTGLVTQNDLALLHD